MSVNWLSLVALTVIHKLFFQYPPFLNKTISRNGTAVYNGIVIEMLDKLANNLHFKLITKCDTKF